MSRSVFRAAPCDALLTFRQTRTLRQTRPCIVAKWLSLRGLETSSTTPPTTTIPLRKHLKDEAKRKKAEAKASRQNINQNVTTPDVDPNWELTVGIEIHAELNTASKLFSAASADAEGTPNTRVAPFDAALPGSQPQFQVATLLPALRAAIALKCQIQKKSSWDRKHYFHWDQPNGYQITQYYEPFARDGTLVLTAEDGVAATDLQGAESVSIGIKQIQMEQDTAKTMHVGSSSYHIDLNRSGLPLIEIITLPHIHSPQTAAAVVRKIQSILKSVDACVTGMEMGGLRADVNVSVRRRGTEGDGAAYGGVTGLGQRTEIKNLSSFKAVEEAIIAERDRQIAILEDGGTIEGETRGWSLGATSTTRLRGKEGEVDYRYMPDPDLPPFYIGADLVDHLIDTLPELPDKTLERIQQQYKLTAKDARTLTQLDDGDRLDFMEEAVALVKDKLSASEEDAIKVSKLVSNWVLHELGGLLSASNTSWQDLQITPDDLSDIVVNLHRKQITTRVAKQLLDMLFNTSETSPRSSIDGLIDANNWRLRPLSKEEYVTLAGQIMDESPDMVAAVKERGQKGKVMWFVGQMIRRGEEGTVEPETAQKTIQELLAI